MLCVLTWAIQPPVALFRTHLAPVPLRQSPRLLGSSATHQLQQQPCLQQHVPKCWWVPAGHPVAGICGIFHVSGTGNRFNILDKFVDIKRFNIFTLLIRLKGQVYTYPTPSHHTRNIFVLLTNDHQDHNCHNVLQGMPHHRLRNTNSLLCHPSFRILLGFDDTMNYQTWYRCNQHEAPSLKYLIRGKNVTSNQIIVFALRNCKSNNKIGPKYLC